AMRLRAKGRWLEAAVESMLHSNQGAAAALRQHQATACTDVTGFGLLGHLLEMLQASKLGADLDLTALPILSGAQAMVQQGSSARCRPIICRLRLPLLMPQRSNATRSIPSCSTHRLPAVC
ncbi:MAG: hypothetical protein HC838_14935, partial [Spirulinaceae cyanobacterium RM2_2_10]|nr:hypothetical protein [Spirulinaceae cyanobacterium RM2_2_10]